VRGGGGGDSGAVEGGWLGWGNLNIHPARLFSIQVLQGRIRNFRGVINPKWGGGGSRTFNSCSIYCCGVIVTARCAVDSTVDINQQNSNTYI
jgi:hypothetical protein